MKTKTLLLSVGLAALGVPCLTQAQFRDNEASISTLAVQCAVSSGFSAGEYEDYCRRLAKTLSMLSGDQQVRVFGYLPQVGSASIGGVETAAAIASPVTSTTTDPGALVGFVRDLNNALSGTTTNATATVVAGATNSTQSAADSLTANTAAKSPSGGSSWGSLLDWLKQAETALKNGTLDTFLKGN